MNNRADILLSKIAELHPKEQRFIFMSMWREMDSLNEGLTADDCIELFTGSLKGSSDFNYELLADICGDYGVGTMNDDFVLLRRGEYGNTVSEHLKGRIPENTELDTEALMNLLKMENVAGADVFLKNVAEKTRFHYISMVNIFIFWIIQVMKKWLFSKISGRNMPRICGRC